MIIISKTELVEDSIKTTAPSIPVTVYRRALEQRKWQILMLMATAMAAAFLIIQQQATYTASVTVALSASAAEKFGSQMAVEQILKSDNALQTVIAKSGARLSPVRLRDRIRAELVTGTTFINIYVADPRADRAKHIADLEGAILVQATRGDDVGYKNIEARVNFVDDELDWLKNISGRGSSPADKEDPLLSGMKNIDEGISAAKAELSRLNSAAIDQNNKAIYAFLLNQRILALEEQKTVSISERLSILSQQQQLIALKQAIQVELDKIRTTRILTPAARPSARDTSAMGRSVIMAGLAALFVGLALALAIKPQDAQDIIG